PLKSVKYLDEKITLLEVRCLTAEGKVGLQTVVPPSTHVSGEAIRFETGCDREPANVDGAVLLRSLARTAAAALLARHWPPEKAGRHDAFLALAGVLVHAKWSLAEVVDLHRAIYRCLWSTPNFEAAEKEVDTTFQRFDDGHAVTGLPKLRELIDKRIVAK